jgi:protein gp37
MGDKSAIHWTDATLNPVTGCSKVSPECDNCYAEKMAMRLKAMGQKNYEDGFDVRCHPDMLKKLGEWTRPRWVFICSMGDPFHSEVPFSFIDDIHDAMNKYNHHKYIVLTKRAQRMNRYFQERNGFLGHVWYGVSVGLRQTVNRINILRGTNVEHKFVSFEPLIGDIFSPYVTPVEDDFFNLRGIEWVIIGGESGQKAREMNENNAEKIVSYARLLGCKVFFKQMGTVWAKKNGSKSRKGDIVDEWPMWARIREMPC